MSKLKVKVERKNKLYFNNYKYKASLKVNGVDLIRNLEYLDKTADRRKQFGVIIDKRQVRAIGNWVEINKSFIATRIESGKLSVFANDLKLLKKLDLFNWSRYEENFALFECEVEGDEQTITLNDPQHKYRIYLKEKRIKTEEIDDIAQVLAVHTATLHPSKSLSRWLVEYKEPRTNYQNWYTFKFTNSGHYIEYDEESSEVLLTLFLDKFMGKKYKLEQRQ